MLFENTEFFKYVFSEKKLRYFMSLTYLVAMQSEDKSTNVGAVIVGPDDEIRSTGYNGLPRGCCNKEERQKRPKKYLWFEHAERNAIYNAARMGTSLKECVIFVNALPCADCARAIIQSGIKKVIFHKKFEEEWKERSEESRTQVINMLKEGNVIVEMYDQDIITNLSGIRNGKLINIK